MEIYNNISKTQLSIAIHYGSAIINGKKFLYDYNNDSLVLESDVKQYEKEIKTIEGAKQAKWN